MPCFAASFREASSRTAAIANRRASAQRLSCRMLPLRASSLHAADHLERPGGSAGASATTDGADGADQTPPLQGDIAAGRDLCARDAFEPGFDGPQGRSRVAEVLELLGLPTLARRGPRWPTNKSRSAITLGPELSVIVSAGVNVRALAAGQRRAQMFLRALGIEITSVAKAELEKQRHADACYYRKYRQHRRQRQ
jgi:hypothetical protein